MNCFGSTAEFALCEAAAFAGVNIIVPALLAVATLNSPQIVGGGRIDLPALAAQATLPAPIVSGGAPILLPVMNAAASLPLPRIAGGGSVEPALLAQAALGTYTVLGGAAFTPALQASAIWSWRAAGGALVAPPALAAQATLPLPRIAGGGLFRMLTVSSAMLHGGSTAEASTAEFALCEGPSFAAIVSRPLRARVSLPAPTVVGGGAIRFPALSAVLQLPPPEIHGRPRRVRFNVIVTS